MCCLCASPHVALVQRTVAVSLPAHPALPHCHCQRLAQLFFIWGNDFGAAGSRALAEALAAPPLRHLRADVKPYSVDGQVSLALQEP
jgi:hypothetical protein